MWCVFCVCVGPCDVHVLCVFGGQVSVAYPIISISVLFGLSLSQHAGVVLDPIEVCTL